MGKKIKVLHVFSQMNRGGAESLIMNVMRNLSTPDIQFDFLVNKKDAGDFDKEIRELGGRIYYITSPRKVNKYCSELRKLLKQIKPDVVHSHLYTYSGLIMKEAKKANIPVRIAHSHTTDDTHNKSLLKKLYISYMKKLIRKNATTLVGCSQKANNDLFGSYNCAKIIPNGIDLTAYRNFTDKEIHELKKELSLNEDAFLIGHVGNFRAVKNHKKVVDVFSEYRKINNRAHLILVGSGSLRQNIEELVKAKNLEKVVHFLGKREDIPQLMKQFDLFLFPSIKEGLGLVLIEAQAAGLRCVASNSIPKEANLGLGLVKFVGVEENNTEWVRELCDQQVREPIDFNIIEDAIKKAHYDIQYSVNELKHIYVNTNLTQAEGQID